MFRTRVVRALLVGCAAFLPQAAVPLQPTSHRPAGLGDPFFPNAGNGGYDVANYNLKLAYDPGTDGSSATPWSRATATQDLSRFNLDLRGFQISRLTVNGARRRSRATARSS